MSAAFTDWLAMGGYAAFVWSSFGLAAVVLTANIVWPYWELRRLKRELREEANE